MPEINPFRGPLDLGIDSEDEVIQASGELAVPSASYVDAPAITLYVYSDSEDDIGFLTAFGLHSTSVTRPGDHVALGAEVLSKSRYNLPTYYC